MAISMKTFDFLDAGDRMADLSLRANVDSEVRHVDVYAIDEHPDNRSVNPEKVKSLKESIAQDGMGQYPLVRINPDDEERYQHISGWHRILANRELFEETKDEKYHRIPVVVLKNCDDKRAVRLMWATNIFSTELTPEERGKGFEVLALEVEEDRLKDPESFKGRRTNEILADKLSAGDKKVSARTIARSRAAYKKAVEEEEQQEESTPEDNHQQAELVKEEAKPQVSTEVEKAINSLSLAVKRIETLLNNKEVIDPKVLKHYQRRLKKCAVLAEPSDK